MAAIKEIRTLVLYFAFLLLFSNNVTCEDSLIIQTVLEYLNSNPNRVYDYTRGQLVDVQFKGGVLEASIDIEANCNGWYPEIPCNNQILTCHSYLGQNNEQPELYKVLSDVRCSPKFDRPVEEVDNVRNVPMSFAGQNSQTGQLDLSHEALPPEQENADFIALSKDSFPCAGCPFDLDKNVEGVSELINLALKHIESEKTQRHKITNVRRLQEQVVAGVKYILEADVAQTSCEKNSDFSAECPLDASVEPFICQVTFFEQPWVSKEKHIIKNNCTVSQEFQLPSNENDVSNEILPQKGSGPSNVRKADISNYDQRLTDIESQIIGADLFEASKTFKTPAESVPEQKSRIEELKVEPLLMQNNSPALRTLYVSMPVVDETEPKVVNYQPQNIQFLPEQNQMHDYLFRDIIPKEEVFKRQAVPKKDSSEEDSKQKSSSNESKSNSSSSSEEQSKKLATTTVTNDAVVVKRQVNNKSDSSGEDSKTKSEDSSEEDEKKRHKRAAYLMASGRSKRSVGQLEKVPSEEKVIVRDLADFAANTLDNIDDDNHKRVILQILGAKKLKLDGIYYQIILRLGISQCQEHEHHESCREKLFTNLTKICKVQVHVDDDYSNPKVVKSQCQNIKKDENDRNRTNYSRYKRQLVGGRTPIENHTTIEKFLHKTLGYVDSVSQGPNKHKVVQIHSATSQVVAGAQYVIKFKLGVTKCLKMTNDEPQGCDLLDNSEPEECEVSVWDRPWLTDTSYTLQCSDKLYKFDGTDNKLTPERFVVETGDAHNVNLSEVLNDALMDLSSKSRIYTYALAWNIKNHDYDSAIIHFTRSKQGHNQLMLGSLLNFEKDKFHCLNLTIKFLEPIYEDISYFTYKTCKTLNSEPMMREAFGNFVDHFGKKYKNQDDYNFRFKVFRDNIQTIELLNRYEQGTATYGITKYTDWTKEEFSSRHGYRPDLKKENELPFVKAVIPDVDLPIEFDWRNKGAVTPVKNQGLCGSCWAFSVTGNVEGQYAIKHGKLLEFSEQELVDCDKVDEGCNGGLMDNAYRVIEKLGGLESESDYPYEGSDDTCHFDVNRVEVQLTGAVNISHNETDMAKWLVANGPISIAINANAMQFYMGGVSHPFKVLCNPNNLDHGVVIVGYGVHTYKLFNKTMPYWIVKNSWGQSWGEQGYYRVYRGDGTCGVNQTPSSALIA